MPDECAKAERLESYIQDLQGQKQDAEIGLAEISALNEQLQAKNEGLEKRILLLRTNRNEFFDENIQLRQKLKEHGIEQLEQAQKENERLKEATLGLCRHSLGLIYKMKKLFEMSHIKNGLRYDISPKFFEDIKREIFIIEQDLKESGKDAKANK